MIPDGLVIAHDQVWGGISIECKALNQKDQGLA